MRASPWFLSCLLIGCTAPEGAVALHDLHQPSTPVEIPTLSDDFYTLPFPNAGHDSSDGTVDLTRHPRGTGTVASWIDQLDGASSGAGLNTAVYFRFDAPIDPDSVDAGVYLVELTPDLQRLGTRVPVAVHYSDLPGKFIGPHWLAVQPLGGLPLRERTTYAVILTDALAAADGGPVRRAPDLDAALAPDAASSSDPRIAAAARAYAPLTTFLTMQPGELDHVVGATVFTTADATSMIGKLREAVYAQAPSPVLTDLRSAGEDQPGVDQLYEGTFVGPIFMSGVAPFRTAGTGAFVLDSSGVPQMQGTEQLRVAFTVPEGTIPPAGWPLVIYAHGHNGDYQEFVRAHLGSTLANVEAANGSTLARFATVSIDQPLHGPRDPSASGTNPDLGYLAFQGNLAAARTVFLQSAADDFQLLRLVKSLQIASAPSTGQTIRFDPDRIYFFGYSQGSSTGTLFVAGEPEIKAAVLGGAGGSLFLDFLPRATKPIAVGQLLSALLHEDVDRFQPVANLLEAYFGATDAESFGRLVVDEPPPGHRPKSVFVPMGVGDSYVSNEACGVVALALGAQLVGPTVAPIANLDLTTAPPLTTPVAGNRAGGAATAVVVQYQPPPGTDGHFVLQTVTAATAQASRFLGSHASTGVATLLAP